MKTSDLIIIYEHNYSGMSYCLIKDAYVDGKLVVEKVITYEKAFDEIDRIKWIIADVVDVKLLKQTKTVVYTFNSGIICHKEQKDCVGELELERRLNWYRTDGNVVELTIKN